MINVTRLFTRLYHWQQTFTDLPNAPLWWYVHGCFIATGCKIYDLRQHSRFSQAVLMKTKVFWEIDLTGKLFPMFRKISCLHLQNSLNMWNLHVHNQPQWTNTVEVRAVVNFFFLHSCVTFIPFLPYFTLFVFDFQSLSPVIYFVHFFFRPACEIKATIKQNHEKHTRGLIVELYISKINFHHLSPCLCSVPRGEWMWPATSLLLRRSVTLATSLSNRWSKTVPLWETKRLTEQQSGKCTM